MIDVISILYDSAIGENNLSDAITAVSNTVGAEAFLLSVGSTKDPDLAEFWTVGLGEDYLSNTGYTLGDGWDPRVNPCVAAGLVMMVGKSQHILEAVTTATLEHSDFIQSCDIFRSLRQRIYVSLRDPDLYSGGFIVRRFGSDFDAAEVARIDSIIPHIGRALRLRSQLDRERSASRNLEALIDNLCYGVMLLDRSGKVARINARCEVFLEQNDDISIVQRRPRLGAAADLMVAAALLGDDAERKRLPPVQGVPIPRRSGASPYLMRVYPAIGFGSSGIAPSVCLVLLIDDPLDPDALPTPELLKGLFSLSQAEAAVARLLPHLHSRQAIAQLLGLSENTVKTHLTSIRQKMNVRTTAEAAHILSRAALAPPKAPT